MASLQETLQQMQDAGKLAPSSGTGLQHDPKGLTVKSQGAPLDSTLKRMMQGAQPNIDPETADQMAHQQVGSQDPAATGQNFLDKLRASQGPNADSWIEAQIAQGGQHHKLGTPGMDTFLTRMNMGFSDIFSEKQEKFKRAFPKGEITTVTVPEDLPSFEAGQTIMMFRESKDAPWRRFDEIGPSAGDVGDVSGAAPSVAGEVAGAIATRGQSIVMRVLGPAMGGTLGEGIRDTFERAIGVKTESAEESGARLLRQAITSATGSMIGEGLSLGARLMTGRGLTHVSQEALDAQNAAKMLGLDPLFPGQIASSPVLQRMFAQSAAKASPAGERIAKQQRTVADFVKGKVDQGAVDNAMTEMSVYVGNAERSLLRNLGVPGSNVEEFGRRLTASLDEWRTLSGNHVHNLFEIARTHGQPTFDINGVRELAGAQLGAIQSGVAQAGSDYTQMLQRIVQNPQVLGDTTIPNPAMPGTNTVIAAEDMLRGWMGDAWRVAHPGGAAGLRTDREMKMAMDLNRLMGRTFDSPIGIADNEAFGTAWREASEAAHKRFNTIEAIDALLPAAGRRFAPMETVDKLWNANSDDTIRLVHRTLTESGLGHRWEAVSRGMKLKMVQSVFKDGPQATLTRLGKFDRSTMRLLMDDAEEKGFRDTLTGLQEVTDMGIRESVAKHATASKAVLDLVTKGDGKNINKLLSTLHPQDNLFQSIRMGLLDHLGGMKKAFQSQGPLKGVEYLDGKAIDETVKRWEELGATKFLEPGDLEMLDGLVKYQRFSASSADVGTSMAAGELAGAAGNVTNPGAMMGAVEEIIRAAGVGYLLTNKAGHLLITGLRPGTRADKYMMRATGATMLDISARLKEERKQGGRGAQDIVP